MANDSAEAILKDLQELGKYISSLLTRVSKQVFAKQEKADEDEQAKLRDKIKNS